MTLRIEEAWKQGSTCDRHGLGALREVRKKNGRGKLLQELEGRKSTTSKEKLIDQSSHDTLCAIHVNGSKENQRIRYGASLEYLRTHWAGADLQYSQPLPSARRQKECSIAVRTVSPRFFQPPSESAWRTFLFPNYRMAPTSITE